MDDLALLKDMADDTPLPSACDLAPARARLQTVFATSDTSVTTDAPTDSALPARRRWRRYVLSGAAVVGLAAAITAVVALAPLEDAGIQPPSAQAEAARVLHLAADATRSLPDVAPRPDQFIYAKTVEGDPGTQPVTGEQWRSVDGSREGLYIGSNGWRETVPPCVPGPVKNSDGGYVPNACGPPAYEPDLPTDGPAMAEYLRGVMNARPDPNPRVPASMGNEILRILSVSYVRPATLAALFDAIAELDGLSVVEHAEDRAGRSGIGVRWMDGNRSDTLVFDAETHAFMGMSGYTATLATAIVDEVGQR